MQRVRRGTSCRKAGQWTARRPDTVTPPSSTTLPCGSSAGWPICRCRCNVQSLGWDCLQIMLHEQMLSLGLTLIRRLIVGASNVRNVIEKTLDTPTISCQIQVKPRTQLKTCNFRRGPISGASTLSRGGGGPSSRSRARGSCTATAPSSSCLWCYSSAENGRAKRSTRCGDSTLVS